MVRKSLVGWFVLGLGVWGGTVVRGETVDFLDYFLQKDDVHDEWTIKGTDVRKDVDPEGGSGETYVLNKWSDPNNYEVYRVTAHEVQIRYEVQRKSGKKGTGDWLRRYEGIGAEGSGPGQVWAPRRVEVGGPALLARHSQDRFHWDEKTRGYVFDEKRSPGDSPVYTSFEWGRVDWGANNVTGFELNPVLRLVSEWQKEGKVFETYDYAKGKGLVNWRWLERISTLPRVTGQEHVYSIEEGQGRVWVEDPGNGDKPRVWKYADGNKGKELEVVKFASHWAKDSPAAWYVVYRELAKEMKIAKKMERVEHRYALPEWEGKAGATIADLPYVTTHREK